MWHLQATFRGRLFRLIKRLALLVAARQSCLRLCGGGALLRNYKPWADRLKANKFPFSPSAQLLQLHCRLHLTLLALLSPAAAVRVALSVLDVFLFCPTLLCSRFQRTFEGMEYQSSLGFRLCLLLFFVCVVATRCAFYVLFSIFAVRWRVVCGSIVRALFRHGVKRIYVT